MRYSAVSTLFAAPLALAGTLQGDLYARGVVAREAGVAVRNNGNDQLSSNFGSSNSFGNSDSYSGNSNNFDNSNSYSSNNYNGGSSSSNNVIIDNNVIIQQSQTTEVILVWYNPGGGAATQTVTTTETVTATDGSVVAAATHTVLVGGAEKVYTPDTIEANIGDLVVFQYQEQNHTVTQSSFPVPCVHIPGGFDSGFVPNINGSVSPLPQVALQVNVSTPLWFYCRQKGHCGLGMTFSINPTANKTQADFQAMAIAQNGTAATAGTVSTSTVAGVAAATSASSSSSSSSSSGSGTLVSGTGSIIDGQCTCQCLCGVADFPSSLQGLQSFGGFAGAVSASSQFT